MKGIYYYKRDERNRPMTTICLMKEGVHISKGVAFCSEKDIPCKKVGRKIAEERARYALLKHTDGCIIRKTSYISMPDSFKSCYMPVLSDHEDKLLNFEGK